MDPNKLESIQAYATNNNQYPDYDYEEEEPRKQDYPKQWVEDGQPEYTKADDVLRDELVNWLHAIVLDDRASIKLRESARARIHELELEGGEQ